MFSTTEQGAVDCHEGSLIRDSNYKSRVINNLMIEKANKELYDLITTMVRYKHRFESKYTCESVKFSFQYNYCDKVDNINKFVESSVMIGHTLYNHMCTRPEDMPNWHGNL